jgi:hypothetical protein
VDEPVDAVITSIASRASVRFTVETGGAGRDAAFALRAAAVLGAGWVEKGALVDGLERDDYDDRAVHVVGWDGNEAVATGRIVLPPGRLPTEAACDLSIEPVGRVADVGRMVVAEGYRDARGGLFVALLARLYVEVRAHGFDVACGMMTKRVRVAARHLGLRLEVLGDEREYWGELRAPIRFELAANATSLLDRWGEGET